MLPKPSACMGCSMYQDGKGFVPDNIPEGAEVLILAQNPGEYEEEGRRVIDYEGRQATTEPCTPQPLVGPTGFSMDRTFLPLTGLDRSEVGVANTLRCRLIKDTPKGRRRVNDMPIGEMLRTATEHCTRAHLRIPPSVKLVIAQGAHAWRLCGGPTVRKADDETGGMGGWRGHLMPPQYGSALAFGEATRPAVLATVHLAYLFKNAKMSLVTRRDWSKTQEILRGEWPKPIPPRVLLSFDTFDMCQQWVETAKGAPYVVLDTEYGKQVGSPDRLRLLGMGYPGMSFVFQVDYAHLPDGLHGFILHWLHELAAGVPFVFQNALADVPVLRAAFDLDWPDYLRIEDTMQAHAVQWCELPHDLDFQTSVDGQYPRLKHLMHEDLGLYNEGDVLETISAWEARLVEFLRDPASRRVYDAQMRLLPHLDRAMRVGLLVDKEKVPPAIQKYQERAEAGLAMAQAYCGWPINPRSDDMLKYWLNDIEGLPVQKHPETKKPTVNADAIATMRAEYLPFNPREEDNPSAERTAGRIEQGGHPLLEAKVLHAKADHVLGHYLWPLVAE